ncbi:unnamed protein product, partial [Hydatigera taeniaeformis]|uniref:FZ domain-containing protein n=1 Tax=Hydatigena taeniaeformis TaxID=6205 RepID=A0A0R3WMG6_HYDTA
MWTPFLLLPPSMRQFQCAEMCRVGLRDADPYEGVDDYQQGGEAR